MLSNFVKDGITVYDGISVYHERCLEAHTLFMANLVSYARCFFLFHETITIEKEKKEIEEENCHLPIHGHVGYFC